MADAPEPDRKSRFREVSSLFRRGARRRARADGRPASPQPTARRISRIVAGALVGVAALAGGLWLAILYMPLPASQVIPRVKAAIEQRLGPEYVVAIEDAELVRSGEGVELRLVELVVSKAGGPAVAMVPRAELRLEGMSLLAGEARIRTVHVTNPKLDMRFDMAVDAASKNVDLPDRILAAVGDLDRLLGPDGAAGALEQVEVTGATLLVAPRARAPLSLEGVDLRLQRGAGGALSLAASSARPENRWTSAVTVSPPAADRSRTIDLGLENVDLAPYSAPFAEKAGAPPLKGRVSGHFNARIGDQAKLLAAFARIESRDISLAMSSQEGGQGAAPGRAVEVDRLQLAMRWDPVKRAVVIDPSQLRGKGGQMTLTGSLGAPAGPGEPWSAALDARDILLSGETPADSPLRLDRIEVAASFDPTKAQLDVSKTQITGPTVQAAMTLQLRFEGASPGVRLGLVGADMPASAVKRLWPNGLASSVRAWVIENVGSGTVDNLSLTIDVGPGELAKLGPKDPLPPGTMALDIGFSNGLMRGAADLPWIENAKGRVLASSRRVDVTIEKAFVANSEADGALAVNNVLFTVPDLAPRHPKARVTLNLDGSLRRALALLATGSFGGNPLPNQLDVAKVTGRLSTDIAIDLELDHGDDGPPPAFKISADMREVKIAGIFAGRDFDRGALQLRAGDVPTTLNGKGVVSSAPATVAVSDAPTAPGLPARRKLSVTLTADAADLQRFGLDVPGSLTGDVPLTADILLDDPKAPMGVTADLAKVGIDGLVPGFKKPAGRAGRLGFVVEKSTDRTTIKDFVLESGERSVRGTIEFGPKGELLSATLPIYRPGPGDDARVEIDKARGGVTKVAVQGAALDLKPVLDKVRGKPGTAGAAAAKSDADNAPKNLDVTVKLGTGLGYGDEAMAGLDVKLTVRDGKVTDADGAGRVGKGPIKLSTGDNGRLLVQGGDAGAFFRFADLYGRIDGGGFDLSASLAGGPGVLRIRDFAVRNETALDRVRTTTGADRSAPTPPARGSTRFDKLQVSFVQSRGQLQVAEAVVTGPQIGASMSGTVNYAADKVDLVGTFVPIYALNNLVSRVPVIGALLGGGKNGGLVGVTFQVKGPTASPTVSINPISAVAPGFLRKMFEFRQNAPAAEAPTGSAAPAQ